MRTATDLRNELAALDRMVTGWAQDEETALLPGVQLMHRSLLRRREHLLSALREAAASELLLVLDGPPVQQHTVTVNHLVKLLRPLEATVASVAQALDDIATQAGVISAAIRDQSTLRLRATFAGSFGLALTGPEPPEAEQLSMMVEQPPPLFERAIDRVLDVMDAANDADLFEDLIIAHVAGLGSRSIGHITDFAKAVSTPNAPVMFAWTASAKPERVVRMTSVAADRLQSVLTKLDSTSTEQPIRGRLVEASLVRRTFGVETAGEEIIRGSVNPAIAHRIEEYFGKEISGTVLVSRTWSSVSEKHAEKYTLLEFAGPIG